MGDTVRSHLTPARMAPLNVQVKPASHTTGCKLLYSQNRTQLKTVIGPIILTVTETWEQHGTPQERNGIRICGVCMCHTHAYTVEYYSALKRMATLFSVT